jgi:hypothetical protein
MTVIIEPLSANVMNACFVGLMSFGLLMTPQQFMKGGKYQSPWFNNLPNERDDKLYYLGQFMGFVLLCGCVIPTLVSPGSQFLCYQMAIIHGINIIHSGLFLFTQMYGDAKPKSCSGLCQWFLTGLLSMVFFVVTALAASHSTEDVVDSSSVYISKEIANITMLAFSSTFALLFIFAPQYLLSIFWKDETLQGGSEICGFQVIEITGAEKWWSRCVGATILGLNLGMAVDTNISQPLYTLGSLCVLSCLTLFNLHQVIMRPYRSITFYQIKVVWIPNILMSMIVISVMICAIVPKSF